MANETVAKAWYNVLMDAFHTLMKKHDMPEDISNELESFMLSVAKEQYRAGNRSGIAYTYKKIREEAAGAAA